MSEPEPWELLGLPPENPPQLLIIGCGNLLRGDDAVGPIIIRRLWQRGLGEIPGVSLWDGGTSGMDVSFAMRGAGKVVLVDATTTEDAPGTIYQVPGSELEELPPLKEMNSHDFRWDHALAFSHWLLGPHAPKDVDVFLINAEQFAPGGELSEAVNKAALTVEERLWQLAHEITGAASTDTPGSNTETPGSTAKTSGSDTETAGTNAPAQRVQGE